MVKNINIKPKQEKRNTFLHTVGQFIDKDHAHRKEKVHVKGLKAARKVTNQKETERKAYDRVAVESVIVEHGKKAKMEKVQIHPMKEYDIDQDIENIKKEVGHTSINCENEWLTETKQLLQRYTL